MKNIRFTINQNFYFYSFLIFAFILPLSRALISFFVVLLPLVWLLDSQIKNKIDEIKNNPVLLAIGIYLVFVFLSLFWTSDIEEGLNTARLYMYWLLIFVFATRVQKNNIQYILSAFLFGMLISEIVAYGVFFDIWTAKYATKEYLSPFMMHIDYSVFLAFASILLLSRILSKEYSTKEKIVYSFFFCTVTGNLFLAPGRTGQLAFLIGFVAIFIVHYKFSLRAILGSFVGLILVFSIAFSLSDTFKTRASDLKTDMQMLQNGNFDGSWGTRVAFIMTSYEIVKENPLLGVGLGGSIPAAIDIFKEKEMPFSDFVKSFITSNHFHNQYLMILVENGLIGFALLLNIIYQLIKKVLKNYEIKEIGVVFLVIFFVSCIAEPLWMKQFTIGLWCLIVGMLALKCKERYDGK